MEWLCKIASLTGSGILCSCGWKKKVLPDDNRLRLSARQDLLIDYWHEHVRKRTKAEAGK